MLEQLKKKYTKQTWSFRKRTCHLHLGKCKAELTAKTIMLLLSQVVLNTMN